MNNDKMSAVREIVKSSSLSEAQRSVLLLMLERSGERFQSVFLEQFQGHAEELPKFYAEMQEIIDVRDDPQALGAVYARAKHEMEQSLSSDSTN